MRTIDEIYRELLRAYAARCGFTPEEGCDLAVRLYAAAAQIQALEMQADWVMDQSFPQTARGIYLDRHAAMRGLERTAATRAVGTLEFSVGAALAVELTVPAETVCMTAEEVRFRTTRATVLPAGELVTQVPAEALEPGSAGNAVGGTVTILTACPVGITGCRNPAAFFGGSDAEGDEALRARILESYRRLPNGANAAWYERTAMNHAGVAAARAVGRARGIGTVDVTIATEAGTPGEALLEEVRADLQEKREIAVDVQVRGPEVTRVDVSLEIAVAAGADMTAVQAAVEQAVTTFFSGRRLGRPVRLAELGSRIYGVEGVENYRFLTPAEDVPAQATTLPLLGTLTVAEMEA